MDFDSESFINKYIASIGTPVSSEDVDTYERLSQIEAVVEGERGQRKLRLIYGTSILLLLSAQIVAVTVFTFLLGFGIISADRWVTATFVGGTLGEVSGMTFLVIRYLFPSNGSRSNS